MNKPTKILVCLLVIALQGCAYTTVKTKDGATLKSFTLGPTNRTLGSLDLNNGTLGSYKSEHTQNLEALAEGFAKGQRAP